MVPCHCSGDPDWQQCGPWTPKWPQVMTQTTGPAQSPVTTGVTDIKSAPLSCSKAPDQDLSHSPGPDISLDSGSLLTIHISPFLTTLMSPNLLLSPTHKPFHLSLSSTSLPCTTLKQWCQTTQCQGSWWGVTGGAWLCTAQPSYKRWCRAVVFPHSHAQAWKPQAVLGTMAPSLGG